MFLRIVADAAEDQDVRGVLEVGGMGDRGQRRSQEAQPCGETTTEDNQSESPA